MATATLEKELLKSPLLEKQADEITPPDYSEDEQTYLSGLRKRLMQARDEVAQLKRARLKDAIDRGYEDVAAGRIIALENDDQIDAFFREL